MTGIGMADASNTVLIVDDEEVIRNICYRSLEKKGYRVELAENGVQALELLRKESVDLVFSDFKMPLMNGIELLAAIKRDYPHVEVVIMTAFATIESAINAMKIGAYDFILKPVKPDQIRIVATKCFEKLHLSEENTALRTANRRLTELQEMKNKFIAITSHELRTPVSHLKGYLGILNDSSYYEQLSSDEQNQCMKVILNAVNDLEEIVTNMHSVIYLENQGLSPALEPMDLNDTVIAVAELFQIIARKREQRITIVPSGQPMRILGDKTQIKGVVRELLQNAIKFTPDGGRVTVTTKVENDYAAVIVNDSGIGIAPGEQGKIFEKFYEIQDSNYHSSSKNAFMGGGLGLGLTAVRAVIEAHGGGVKLKSTKGQGSEFLVFLPLIRTAEAAQ
jgi:signal transduction histidine kinase